MACAGLVGGLGPESTIDYYRRILQAWALQRPGSAPSIVIDSLDVQHALRLAEHDHAGLTDYLSSSLARLHGAGASFVALTANTPHVVFDALAARSAVPLLSIVETCADEAQHRGLARLALLGTRFTMAGAFYPRVFERRSLALVRPDEADMDWVHACYIGELLKGVFRDESRRRFIDLVERMRAREGIDGVILGGTELPLLLTAPEVAGLPALDTTALHVDAIVGRLLAS